MIVAELVDFNSSLGDVKPILNVRFSETASDRGTNLTFLRSRYSRQFNGSVLGHDNTLHQVPIL